MKYTKFTSADKKAYYKRMEEITQEFNANGKMTVLLVTDNFYPVVDGVLSVVDNYARRLSGRVNVMVCAPVHRWNVPDVPYPVLYCDSMYIHPIRYDYSRASQDRKFRELLNKLRIDIIHIHSPYFTGRYMVDFANKNNIPVISTFHTQYRQDLKRVFKTDTITDTVLDVLMKVFYMSDKVLTMNTATLATLRSYGFDGDAAGEMATWRSLDMLQSVGLDVKVMSLPEGMDPDDVCKSYGADGFRKLMSEAKPLTEFKIRQLAAKENMDTFAGREAFALKALPVLEALSPIGRDAHIQLVSELSNLSAESIKNSLQNFTVTRKTATKSGEEAHAEDEDKITKTELKNGRILLKLLLDGADYAKVSELDEECFKLPLHKRIFNYISEKNKAGLKLKTGELFALEPDSTEELEAIMSATDGYTIESAEKMYNAILSGIYKARKKSIMAELTAKIKLADGAEKQKLEEKLLKLINLRK